MNEWIPVDELYNAFDCGICDAMCHSPYEICPKCGSKMDYVLGPNGGDIPREKFIKCEINKWITLGEIKKNTFGNVYTIEDFITLCDDGYITPYDGVGYFHDGDKETDISVFNTTLRPEDVWDKYFYIVWYNK